ncbi:MAG: ECF RNA polymerase sigma factor SigK [Nocardioidaceae bacterium]
MRPPAHVDELGLVLARVARGDQAAFTELYDATAAMVFGVVLRVLRDHAQAEEVSQEVFVEAWRFAPRYDSAQGTARAWLNMMAHRRAVDRVRSSERTRQRERRDVESTLNEPTDDPSDIVVTMDQGRQVRKALAGLPEAQRTALVLAYFEGRTQRDIADQLHLPLGTVKTRIRDAMRRLRDQIGEAP